MSSGLSSFDLQGAVSDANEAFLQMVQYTREDLVTGRVHWTDLTPAEWSDRDQLALAELQSDRHFPTYEKEYSGKMEAARRSWSAARYSKKTVARVSPSCST